jgi:hypothetical protein
MHPSKKRQRADDDDEEEHSPPSAPPTGDQSKLSKRQLNAQKRKQKFAQKNNKGVTGDVNEPGANIPSQSERQHKRARLDETGLAAESTSQAEASSRISPSKQKSSKSKDDDEKKMDTRALYQDNKEEIDQWYDEYISRKSGIAKYNKALRSKDPWFNKLDAWMKDKGIAQTPKKVDDTPKQTKKTVEETREVSPEIKPHHIKYPGDKVRVPEYPFDKLADFTPMPDGRYPCSHPFPLDKNCCKYGYSKASKKSAIKKSIETWRRKMETLIDNKDLDERHKTWEDWTKDDLMKKYQPDLWNDKQKAKQEKSKAKWVAQSKKRGLAEMTEESADEPDNKEPPRSKRGASDEADDEELPPTKRQKTTQPSLEHQSANTENAPPHQHRDLPQPLHSSAGANRQNSEDRSQRRHKNRKGRRSPAHHNPSDTVQESGGVLVEPVAARPNATQPRTQAPMPMTQVQTVQSPVRQEPGSVPEENIAASGGIQTHPPAVNQLLQAPVPQAQPIPSAGVHRPSEGSVEKPVSCPGSESTYELPAGMMDFDTMDSELDRFLSVWPLLNPANQTDETLLRDSPADGRSPTMVVSYDSALSSESPVDERSLTMSTWLNHADQMAALPPNSPADEQLLCQTIEDGKADWQRYCDFMDEHDGEEEL